MDEVEVRIPLQVEAEGSSGAAEDRSEDTDYYQHCLEAHQKSQEDYDKTLLTLSGGALGLSITFVEKIASPAASQHKWLLLIAWIAWLISVAFVLWSYFSSIEDLKRILDCLRENKEIQASRTVARVTYILNIVGGITFIIGVIAIAAFAYLNLK